VALFLRKNKSGGTKVAVQKSEKKEIKIKREEADIPKGKVRCFISKQIVDESETVEIDFNGVRVRVHKKYARV